MACLSCSSCLAAAQPEEDRLRRHGKGCVTDIPYGPEAKQAAYGGLCWEEGWEEDQLLLYPCAPSQAAAWDCKKLPGMDGFCLEPWQPARVAGAAAKAGKKDLSALPSLARWLPGSGGAGGGSSPAADQQARLALDFAKVERWLRNHSSQASWQVWKQICVCDPEGSCHTEVCVKACGRGCKLLFTKLQKMLQEQDCTLARLQAEVSRCSKGRCPALCHCKLPGLLRTAADKLERRGYSGEDMYDIEAQLFARWNCLHRLLERLSLPKEGRAWLSAFLEEMDRINRFSRPFGLASVSFFKELEDKLASSLRPGAYAYLRQETDGAKPWRHFIRYRPVLLGLQVRQLFLQNFTWLSVRESVDDSQPLGGSLALARVAADIQGQQTAAEQDRFYLFYTTLVSRLMLSSLLELSPERRLLALYASLLTERDQKSGSRAGGSAHEQIRSLFRHAQGALLPDKPGGPADLTYILSLFSYELARLGYGHRRKKRFLEEAEAKLAEMTGGEKKPQAKLGQTEKEESPAYSFFAFCYDLFWKLLLPEAQPPSSACKLLLSSRLYIQLRYAFHTAESLMANIKECLGEIAMQYQTDVPGCYPYLHESSILAPGEKAFLKVLLSLPGEAPSGQKGPNGLLLLATPLERLEETLQAYTIPPPRLCDGEVDVRKYIFTALQQLACIPVRLQLKVVSRESPHAQLYALHLLAEIRNKIEFWQITGQDVKASYPIFTEAETKLTRQLLLQLATKKKLDYRAWCHLASGHPLVRQAMSPTHPPTDKQTFLPLIPLLETLVQLLPRLPSRLESRLYFLRDIALQEGDGPTSLMHALLSCLEASLEKKEKDPSTCSLLAELPPATDLLRAIAEKDEAHFRTWVERKIKPLKSADRKKKRLPAAMPFPAYVTPSHLDCLHHYLQQWRQRQHASYGFGIPQASQPIDKGSRAADTPASTPPPEQTSSLAPPAASPSLVSRLTAGSTPLLAILALAGLVAGLAYLKQLMTRGSKKSAPARKLPPSPRQEG